MSSAATPRGGGGGWAAFEGDRLSRLPRAGQEACGSSPSKSRPRIRRPPGLRAAAICLRKSCSILHADLNLFAVVATVIRRCGGARPSQYRFNRPRGDHDLASAAGFDRAGVIRPPRFPEPRRTPSIPRSQESCRHGRVPAYTQAPRDARSRSAAPPLFQDPVENRRPHLIAERDHKHLDPSARTTG